MLSQKITLGFSPCPNDTFMFCALVNGLIDCGNIEVIPVIEDVETLNKHALRADLDVTKLSMNAYAHSAHNYFILNAGSALGNNCGPLLISKKKYEVEDVKKLHIATPGRYTTANLLLSIFFPEIVNKSEMIFSEIENAVLHDKADAGLIIHENRFTYQQKGLLKIADMGELWEQKTNVPIPLGCIAVNKKLDAALHHTIDSLILQSIQFAFANPAKVMNYVKKYSQEMEQQVMQQHIQLYVNEFSLALGAEGKKAIQLLLKKGNEAGLLPQTPSQIFIS